MAPSNQAAPALSAIGPKAASPLQTRRWTKSGISWPMARRSKFILNRVPASAITRWKAGPPLFKGVDLVPQKLSDGPQPLNVVAHRLQPRGQRNGQQQPRRVPKKTPQHQGKRD